MKNNLMIKLYILIILLLLSTTYTFATTDHTLNLVDTFEYTLVDKAFHESSISEIEKLEAHYWHKFDSIDALSKIINNNQTVWFRTLFPRIDSHNSGLFFDDFRANSMEVYIHSNLEYYRYRDLENNHNTFLLSISKPYTNSFIYIKTNVTIPNIGPTKSILLGEYTTLEQAFLSKNIDNLYIGFIVLITATFVLIYSIINWGNYTKAGIALFIIASTIGIMLLFYSPALQNFYPNFEKIGITLFECLMYLGSAALIYFLYIIIDSNSSYKYLRLITITFNTLALIATLTLCTNRFYNILSYDQYLFLTVKLIVFFVISTFLIITCYTIKIQSSDLNIKIFRFAMLALFVTISVELILSMITGLIYTPILWKYAIVIFIFFLIIILTRLFTYNKKNL